MGDEAFVAEEDLVVLGLFRGNPGQTFLSCIALFYRRGLSPSSFFVFGVGMTGLKAFPVEPVALTGLNFIRHLPHERR